jgi:ligand-binding sensor domain-containing protein/two-component sensor histidine kinase
MNRILKIVFAGYLVLFSLQAHTQHRLSFATVNRNDGLSSDNILCLFKDSQGFLWIGSVDGLNRYDGVNVKVYRYNPLDSFSISGNSVNDITEDENGILWITTFDGGICSYNRNLPEGMQFRRYSLNTVKSGLIAASSVAIDGNNNVYAGQKNPESFLMLDKKKHVFTVPFKYHPGEEKIIRSDYSNCLATDNSGNVWSAGRFGLYHINSRELEVTKYNPKLYQEDTIVNSITYVLPEASGILWLSGSFNGIASFDPKNNKLVQYNSEKDRILSTYITVIKNLHSHFLLLGTTTEGLGVFNKVTGKTTIYKSKKNDDASLVSNNVRDILIEKNGTIWIATDKGVSFYDPRNYIFKTEMISDNPELQVEDKINIRSMYINDREKQRLIATLESFWFYNYDSQKYEEKHFYENGKEIKRGKLIKMTADTFIVFSTGGVHLLSYSDRKLKKLEFQGDSITLNESMKKSDVSAAFIDSVDNPGIIWYGKLFRIFRFDLNTMTVKSYKIRTSDTTNFSSNFSEIMRDRNGTLWLACRGLGVFRVDNEQTFETTRFLLTDSLLHDRPLGYAQDMIIDSDNVFWVPNIPAGLFKGTLDKNNNLQFKLFSVPHGLLNTTLYAVVEDKKGYLWVPNRNGVSRFDKKTERFINFSFEHGLTYPYMSFGKFYDDIGYIYFSSRFAVVKFHPDSLYELTEAPQVVITDFKIYDKPYNGIFMNRTIELAYDQNYFSFEFTSTELSNAKAIKFEYRLVGHEPKWNTASERRYASYTNVPPGSYSFVVRAYNSNGVWNEKGETINLIIAPPFWQTWWFFLLSLGAVIVTTYSIYRFLLRKNLEKHHAIIIERQRISADLHDDIGSGLSKISLLSELIKRESESPEVLEGNEKISKTLQDISGNLSEIIWSLNSKNDFLENLIAYIRRYAGEYFENTAIAVKLKSPSHIPHIPVTAAQRRNIFYVVKEALHNIVKHSCASQVDISFDINECLVIIIHDNGKGFHSEDAIGRHYGNGIKNMKNRMKSINGSFFIENTIGTKVTLQFPVKDSSRGGN